MVVPAAAVLLPAAAVLLPVARAIVAESVKPGVVVSQGVWWNRYTPDGVNCNTTTSTALSDLGGGATFFDNLVEVEALETRTEPGDV